MSDMSHTLPEPPAIAALRRAQAAHERQLPKLLSDARSLELKTLVPALLARTAPAPFEQVDNEERVRWLLAHGDVLEALVLRTEIPADSGAPQELRVARQLVREFVGARGIEQVLGWFLEARQRLLSGSPTRAAISWLEPEHPDRCTCRGLQSAPPSWIRYPSLAWIHANHALYNRAVRAFLTHDPDTIPRVRQALNDAHGARIRERFNQRSLETILEFAQMDHDPSWVGPRHVIGIVDDDPLLAGELARRCPDVFGPPVELVQVRNRESAVPGLLETGRDPDAIVVDGDFPSLPADGVEIVAGLREAGYDGPLIAVCSSPQVRDELLRAGCVAACDGYDLPLQELVREHVPSI